MLAYVVRLYAAVDEGIDDACVRGDGAHGRR